MGVGKGWQSLRKKLSSLDRPVLPSGGLQSRHPGMHRAAETTPGRDVLGDLGAGLPREAGPHGAWAERTACPARDAPVPSQLCQKNLGRAQKPPQGEVPGESFPSSGFFLEQEG